MRTMSTWFSKHTKITKKFWRFYLKICSKSQIFLWFKVLIVIIISTVMFPWYKIYTDFWDAIESFGKKELSYISEFSVSFCKIHTLIWWAWVLQKVAEIFWNIQSVSVKFIILYIVHKFYRKWLKFRKFQSLSVKLIP